MIKLSFESFVILPPEKACKFVFPYAKSLLMCLAHLFKKENDRFLLRQFINQINSVSTWCKQFV